MIAGIFIGLGIAAVVWITWYLAPLGDPETGAGRQEYNGRNGNGYQPLRSSRDKPLIPPGAE